MKSGLTSFLRCSLVMLMAGLAAPGLAANGMNAPGHGAVQLGLAGAGTAMAEDSFAILRNPAAAAWLESGAAFDLGIAIPDGKTTVGPVDSASQFGLIDIEPGRYQSVSGVFPIPAYARNWRLDPGTAIGWGLTASGLKSLTSGGSAALARGLPTFDARCQGSFAGGEPVPGRADLMGLCGNSGAKLGVDLTQVLLSAHYARRIGRRLSLGIEPVFAAQRVLIRGIGAFAAFSNTPPDTSDNGYDFSYGGGLRLGLLWEVSQGFGLGAAYQTRLYQSSFGRYDGVIIGGSLDFAPVLNVGAQFHLAPGHRLLADLEYIEYSRVTPLDKQIDPQRFADECFIPRVLARSEHPDPISACLGGSTGPGFGWGDVRVYKLGYQADLGKLSLRAGYSWGGNPVNAGQTLPKFYAPAVTDQHASIGLSIDRANGSQLQLALVHALKNSIRERNIFSNAQLSVLNGQPVGYQIGSDPEDQILDSSMSIWELHFTYAWRP